MMKNIIQKIIILLPVLGLLNSCGTIKLRDNFETSNENNWEYSVDRHFDYYWYHNDKTDINIKLDHPEVIVLFGFPLIPYIPLIPTYYRERGQYGSELSICIRTNDSLNINLKKMEIITDDSIYFPSDLGLFYEKDYIFNSHYNTNIASNPNIDDCKCDSFYLAGSYYLHYDLKIQNYDSIRIKINGLYDNNQYFEFITPNLKRTKTMYYDLVYPFIH
jgi:hypothetical protein